MAEDRRTKGGRLPSLAALYEGTALFVNSDYLPLKVIHFVLDYLRLIVAEDTAAALELLIQVLHGYSAETCDGAHTVQ